MTEYREDPRRAGARRVVNVLGVILVLALGTVAIREAGYRLQGPQGIAPQVAQVRGAVVHVDKAGVCQGSGCIVDPQGIVFTAKHVTDHTPGAYTVTLDNGKSYPVKYALEDREHDVAFLKLDLPAGVTLPVVELADLSAMRVGDPVFIMGSPLGRFNFNSVSLGILSAMQRDLDSSRPGSYGYGWRVTFQSTSPAYPGNSGGPVFNVRGEVIGVLVAGVDATLNYSVPVAVFKDRLDTVRNWFALSRFEPVPDKVPDKPVVDEDGFSKTGGIR